MNSPLLSRRTPAQNVDRNYGSIHDYALNQYKTLLARTNNIPRMSTDVIKDVGTNTIMFTHKLLARAKQFAGSPGVFKMGTQFFASAPSNVLKRLPGYSIGVSAFGGSLIDTTQFGWRFGVRLVLRLTTAGPGEDMAPVLWQVETHCHRQAKIPSGVTLTLTFCLHCTASSLVMFCTFSTPLINAKV